MIVRTPLCFGFLTGEYAHGSAFAANDHRSGWSQEQLDSWVDAGRIFAEALRGADHDTPAQKALSYCLSYEAVATTIPGMLTVAHVEENAVAGGMEALPAEVLCKVETLYESHRFFLDRSSGPG